MPTLLNGQYRDLARATNPSDAVTFDQLDTRIRDIQKRQAYFHGTPVSGVIVTLANGTTILDNVDPSPPFFYPSQVFIRQINAGTLLLGAATINIGTNAPNYDNVIGITQLMIAGLGQGRYVPLTLSGGVTPLPASSVIRVRIAGLTVGSTVQIAVDILGSYRSA